MFYAQSTITVTRAREATGKFYSLQVEEWEGVMEQYRCKTCSRVEKGGEGDYIHPHHTPLLFPGYVRA